ncbi:Sir2 family [Novymonas esmeraldas]|uniref:Sir2 family n=1 Tax=Novymonas esmeraldas TaxID=1808958 RepID=A0AAW0F5Q6_9TRYP
METAAVLSSSVVPPPTTDVLECVSHALAAAHRVVVFSGAGMSAESGIHTFRDPEVGLWRNKIALALFGIPLGWRWMPSIAWWGYKRFHAPIAAALPNSGHLAVAELRTALQLRADGAV